MAPEKPPTNMPQVSGFCTNHKESYPAIDPLKANLSGKSVVITGASKGVGRATALSFARAGCSRIAISARSPLDSLETELRAAAKEAKRPELTIVNMTVDVTSEDDVKKYVAAVDEKFGGKVDVLVNNAGYMEEWVPFAETEPSKWWRSWEVNIRGLYLCARHFLPLVLASETKAILNMSSTGAHGLTQGASAYQSTKFAVCRLAEFMTSDHWDDGLVAIAMHPGGLRTELGLNMPKFMHKVLVDAPELPGDFMVWLVSGGNERREWLRGRYLSANWDVDELVAKKDEIVEGDKLKFRLVL
ncbi:uncharacterized protein BCR38DRAFT_421993 [Pseudomassariella vexata]|uniref:Oxidoreductase n=1 Tax=Pseudomassariella vexata TaxID=1141098 RepID=A0A1Y2EFP7_9PEZI|nr:uncharacterized protein BCR38DRAFT_421993 [Pseudomassariella vexata]ORY70401.1 hypothetical protein BCR38DRAFT_421993 [Pseudomassariella vexata]